MLSQLTLSLCRLNFNSRCDPFRIPCLVLHSLFKLACVKCCYIAHNFNFTFWLYSDLLLVFLAMTLTDVGNKLVAVGLRANNDCGHSYPRLLLCFYMGIRYHCSSSVSLQKLPATTTQKNFWRICCNLYYVISTYGPLVFI